MDDLPVAHDAGAADDLIVEVQVQLAVLADGLIEATVADGQLRIELSGNCNPGSCDTYLVSYLPQASTHVGRGENAGQTLVEWNIVRSVQKLGTTKGETTAPPAASPAASWQIAVSTLPADATKLAIVVQDSHSGGVRGARVVDLHS